MYPLSLSPTSTTAGSQDLCTKMKARFPHLGEGKALPSYCPHPGGYHVTSHAASRLKKEHLSLPWPLVQAQSSSATNGCPTRPCPAPRTCRCSHRYDTGLLLHLQSCSTAYQHTTQCQVPLLGTAAICNLQLSPVHRKLGKLTANSLCALANMTHSFPDQAWSPWTILASQSRTQSEPCWHFLLPFVYDFQSMALVTSLQWKERKITMPAAKIILLLIMFPVLYLRPILQAFRI